MAQQDTGLGWSAKSDWLVSAGAALLGKISEYEATGYPAQPLPYTPTNGDLSASGLLVGTYWQYRTYYSYLGCATEGVSVFVGYISVYDVRLYFNAPSFTLKMGYKTDPDGAADVYDYTITGHYDSALGLYWANRAIASYGVSWNTTNVFDASDVANIITSTETSFYKLNAGYAVAALVNWASLAGDVITSPVLISTDENAVILSNDGITEIADQMIADYLYQGIRFHMSFLNIRDKSFSGATVPIADLTPFAAAQPKKVFALLADASFSNILVSESPDPYEEEGAGSEEEGGSGEETEDDDAGIEAGSDFPSAINTGFCRIFSPSESELRDLSNYLWSNSYDLTQVKKLFSNPMDSILGLSAVPIRLLGSSVSFSLGGVPITGMTLPLVTQQRYTYHMGSITIKERWGSYLDYDPYTKFSIFLPFIGMRELSADDIMGKTVGLVYDIDILTGMCVARLQAGTNCLYEWGGNCAIQLPINSRNWDSVFSTAVSAVGGIVSAVTGGSAPLVAGSVASAALQTVSMKPRIDKSSTIGGAAGWLGQMTPYIIRTTPDAFIPTDQNKFIGYPAYVNVALNSISGYNEVESIHLENVTATGTELEEIESILKGGVIF